MNMVKLKDNICDGVCSLTDLVGLWATCCVKSVQMRSSFWSIFSRIRTEYGEILRISPYSVRMRGNTDQNNFEYRHFLRSGYFKVFTFENEMWWRFIWNNLSEFVSWNRLVESMLDLYYFVLWLVVCLLFVKLFTWDFVFIVYIGFDWRYVEKVTRKIKKREIDNV